jgi:hypothetical protein
VPARLTPSPGVAGGDFAPVGDTGWVGNLSYGDLQRLRRAVRQVHLHYLPASCYTHREADKIIEALGPLVAERLIRRAVEEGL